MIMRKIWLRRNEFMYENNFVGPGKIVQMENVSLEDFHQVRMGKDGGHSREGNRRINRWRKSEGSRCKANFDAAYEARKQKMGVGIVIKDSNGDVLALISAPKYYVASPFIVESNALWKAMEMCNELGFRDVIFEGDAKAIIDVVNSEEDDESWRGQIIEDIKKIVRQREWWSVAFVHREGNVVAHQLAKLALQNEEEICWIEDGPSNIHRLIVHDKECNEFSDE